MDQPKTVKPGYAPDPNIKKVVVHIRLDRTRSGDLSWDYIIMLVEHNGSRGRGNVLLKLRGEYAGTIPFREHLKATRYPNAEIRVIAGDEDEHMEWLWEGLVENPACMKCGNAEERCFCIQFHSSPWTPLSQMSLGVGGWPLLTINRFALMHCPKCFSRRVRTIYNQRFDHVGRWVECNNICQNCRHFHTWSKFEEVL